MEETMRTLRPEKQRRRPKIAVSLITLCAAALLSYAAFTGTLAAPKQLAGARTQLPAAAASAPSFFGWAAGAIYRTFCPYVSDCDVEYAALNSQQQPTPTAAKPQPLPAQNSPDGSARLQASSTQPIVYQTVNQPVIERVIERQRVVTEDGVSETTLADRLNQLENKLRALIFSQSSQQSAQTSAVYNAVALSQRIDNLSGTNISNPTITGGSITGSSIIGTISNAIATALATIDNLTSITITATNATFTNSTTTNATTTNLYAASLTAGNATTTSLAVLGAATSSFGGGVSAARVSASATSTFSGLVLESGQLRLSPLDCSSYANGGTLTTDASGNVVCAADDGGAGSTVAGADTQIQFNNGGSFGAAANFTFSSSTGKLTLPNASTTNLTASYASSTQGFFGSLSLGSLSGVLKATGGLVSAASPGSDYESPLTFGYPLTRSLNAISLAFGTTTTNTWTHQIFSSLFASGASTTNATTTNLHITGLSNSGLGVDANGKVYAAATSTLSNISGTLAPTQLANQNANTVLANATAGSAAPTAIATSSFFGTGAGGQVLAWNSGVPQWVATTTLTNGTGITTTYSAASNQWTIANTGATFAFPFTTLDTFGTTSAATSSSIHTAGVFFASSTVAASQFPFASSTAITISGTASTSFFFANGLTNCSSNNNLTWVNGTFGCEPDDTATGEAPAFAWESNYAAVNAATSSVLWAKFGINASSTSHFANASTTLLTVGTQWFTSLANSGLGVDANGKVYAAATSSLATISGQLNLSQIAIQAANTVLVNNTAGAAAPTALSTSTFAATLYSGTPGQTLAYLNGAWTGAATTTLTNGSGITTSYNAGTNQWTITNTSLSIGDPFTHSTNFATTTSATTTSLHTAGVFFASSTAAASQFPFASTTAISATTLCLTSDCRTSWPTGGGIGDPFTHQSYAAQTTSATSSTLWLTNPTLSLAASSTFANFASSTNASSSLSTIGALWLPPLGTPAGSFIAVNAEGQVIATATPAVGGGGTVTNVSGANGISGSVSSNGSLSLISYLATSSSEVAGNLSYWTTTAGNPAQLGTVATTSLGFSGPFTGFSSLGSLVGGSNAIINWTGLSTTSQPASSNILVSDGTNGVYGAATTSLGVTGPITFSGTLGAQIGGAAGTFGCTTAASGVTGCLTGTDWDTFNNKQVAGNYITALTGDVTASGPGSASVSFALGNTHWWTAQQNFRNASTSQFTATSSVWFTSLGTPAGTFLAVDPNGLLIATSTPAVGGSGTVTNIATTYPITGGPITTTGTLSLAFGTTTTNTWTHQIFSSLFALSASSTNATTTNLHITGLTNSGLGVDANGKVYAAATSTLATISGTLALAQLANQNANTVLANVTAGSAAPTAIATSSLFGSGIGGTVLSWSGGVPQWVATTTLTNGAGITTTYSAASNQWTINNTGATFGYPFSTSETFATSTSATSTSIWTQGVFFASSTVAASQFPFASSTALSADTLCLSTDCRTSWPTGGGGSDPFPLHTSYAGLTTSGTSSTLWLTGSTISLAASSSVLTFASSTAFTVSGASYFDGGFLALASSTIGDGTQAGGLTVSGGATTTGNAYFASNLGIGTASPGYALDVNGDVNVASGNCYRVGGVCIGYVTKLAAIYATSSAGTTTVAFGNGGPRFSSGTLTLPATTTQMVVELWGGGGGGTGNGQETAEQAV